jgi:thiol-disulfide isomerase/thioredoxin
VTRRLGPAAAAIAAALLLGACAGTNAVDPTAGNPKGYFVNVGTVYLPPAQRGQPVRGVRGRLLSGREFSLSGWAGHVVVVNFWGSWCAPCRAEADGLAAVARRTARLGVRFLGVDVRDNVAAAQAFDQTHKVTYPSIFDVDDSVVLHFRGVDANSTPTTVVLDRQGRVAATVTGEVDYTTLLSLVRRVAGVPSGGPGATG